jgi:hypothetical protein
MAESSLSLAYQNLQEEVGAFLGFTSDSTAWSDYEKGEIDRIIKKGLSMFYWPAPLPGMRNSHEWSFLRAVGEIETEANVYEYDLPDNFGVADSTMSIEPPSGHAAIAVMSEAHLRRLRQPYEKFGVPRIVAISSVPFDGTAGTRFKAQFFPTPDRVLDIRYSYSVLADMLTLDKPYPLGGAIHSDTLREACLAAAESTMDDTAGVHHNLFLMRLAASVSIDQKNSTPAFFGYNGDPANATSLRRERTGRVSYDGNYY